jgi:hypothetical protein
MWGHRQDVQLDVLLRDPLDVAAENGKIVDVARIGDPCSSD